MPQHIVVVGAGGTLGRAIMAAGRAEGHRMVGHGRSTMDLVTPDPVALRAAVRGADTIISAVQGGPNIIIDGQRALLAAARDEGVPRFIASTFSFDIFRVPRGTNIGSDWRRTFAEHAASVEGVATTHVVQGIFTSRDAMSFMELVNFESREVAHWGDTEHPIAFTSVADTARASIGVADSALAAPHILAVAGDILTPSRLAEALSTGTGAAFRVVRHGSLADLDALLAARQAESPRDFSAWVGLTYTRVLMSGVAVPDVASLRDDMQRVASVTKDSNW